MLLRRFTTTATTGPFPASASAAPRPAVVRSGAGFIRGSLWGFLIGVTLTGGAGYVYLLDEYQMSSQSLLSSVEDLQKSVNRLKTLSQRTDDLGKDQQLLQSSKASKKDLEALRNELLKAIDDTRVAHGELKVAVWELGQDVKGLKN